MGDESPLEGRENSSSRTFQRVHCAFTCCTLLHKNCRPRRRATCHPRYPCLILYSFLFTALPFFSHSRRFIKTGCPRLSSDEHASWKFIRDEQRKKKGIKNGVNIARVLISINAGIDGHTKEIIDWLNESRGSLFSQLIVRSIPSRVPRILRKGGKSIRAPCNLLSSPRYYSYSLLRIHATEVNISSRDIHDIKLRVTKASAVKAVYPIAFFFSSSPRERLNA